MITTDSAIPSLVLLAGAATIVAAASAPQDAPAAADRPSDTLEARLVERYGSIDSLAVTLDSTDADRRIVVAADRENRYAFIQYDKHLLGEIYAEHMDTDQKWRQYPAHISMYDGRTHLRTTDPLDPARLLVDHTLDEPMRPAQSIQHKHCIWPLIPELAARSGVERTERGFVIESPDADLKVHFNDALQVSRVTSGEFTNDGRPLAVLRYHGYAPGPDRLFPDEVTRAFRTSVTDEGEPSWVEDRATLEFEDDQAAIDRVLGYDDNFDEYHFKDASTAHVHDADGTFLYDEREIADKHRAATQPGSTGWLRSTLLAVAAIAIGAAGWIGLKSRRAT